MLNRVATLDIDEVVRRIRAHPWRQLTSGALAVGSGAPWAVIDPSRDEEIVQIPSASPSEVADAIGVAHAAAKDWARMPVRERSRLVRLLADRLEENSEELAWLDTVDAGLPIWMTRIDAATGVERMRMFADMGHSLTGQTLPASGRGLHLTFPEPFGVVARIIPFNHPFMFAASKMAAPLIAGNAVVLKPSELTPLSALRLGELAADILPPGVFSVLHGGPDVGDELVRDPRIARIAFTGSHAVGRAIQRAAADTGVKSVTLELGGKNALIAFPDADPGRVVAAAVKGMNFAFSGQSCGSTSRVLVHSSLFAEVRDGIVAGVEALQQGMPWDEGVQMGPMVSRRQQERALGFIRRADDAGCRVLTGGSASELAGPGFFVPPTVLDDVDPGFEIAREEVFGPVLSLLPFSEEVEAVAIANDVEYGLTASVWTDDLDRAFRVSADLDVGYLWINDTSTHFPGVPFGGVKLSGVGREESVDELMSYTQLKAINVVPR